MMSATEVPSIFDAIKRAHWKRFLPLWEWDSYQINAFDCDLVAGNSTDLSLSINNKADLRINHVAFSVSEYPD